MRNLLLTSALLTVALCTEVNVAHATTVEEDFVSFPWDDAPGGVHVYDYILETPSEERTRPRPKGGWPVVLLFHGAGQSMDYWTECFHVFTRKICTMREFKELLHAEGFATLAGSSKKHLLPNPFNPSEMEKEARAHWIAWHVGNYADYFAENPDKMNAVHAVPYALRRERELAANPDLHFVEAVLAELSPLKDGAGNLYDTRDVYAAGMSNGAQFTMFVAEYLPDVIQAAAIQLGGYGPPLGKIQGPNWKGDIPANHKPMIVVNTLGLDWVLPIFGIAYKNDLIKSGIQACHFTHVGGTHAWHGEYNQRIIELFRMPEKVLPRNIFCLPKSFKSP